MTQNGLEGSSVGERVDVAAAGPQPLRVLVLYYSQSGDVNRAVESFIQPLRQQDVELTVECLRPCQKYPFPWKNLFFFFNIFPECVVGDPPEIEPPEFAADARFDLVIIGYQVWFLSPSLPIQAFFKTAHADVLADTKVITLSVSRNMWHSAGETMKQLLARARAIHVDNAAIVHQGPVWATFITTTRMLFFGKKDRLWGIFPPAGITDETFNGVTRLGEAIANQLSRVREPDSEPFLRGLDPAPINRRYVLPELCGWYIFSFWAKFIRASGRIAGWLRAIGVLGFVVSLVAAIVIGIPLLLVARILLYPLLRRPLSRYVARLQQPSEMSGASTVALAPR